MLNLDFNNLKVYDNIYLVEPNLLTVHPTNLRIYIDHVDLALDEDIKAFGIRTPLIINKQAQILDGRRRWNRARQFGIAKIPVIIRYYEDEDLAIVMLNKYRQKTPRELYLESKILEEKYRDLYKRGRPPKDTLEKRPQTAQFSRLEEHVANQLDISRTQLRRLKTIYENENEIPLIVKALDEGTISITKAAQCAKLVLEEGLPEKRVIRQAIKNSIKVPRPKITSKQPSQPKLYKVRCPECNKILFTNRKTVDLIPIGDVKSYLESRKK